MNRVCDLLGIRYPVIYGVASGKHPDLCAAVSNAGGLGTLHGGQSARAGLSSVRPGLTDAEALENLPRERRKESIRAAIRQMKKLTNKPFSINVPITIQTTPGLNDDVIDLAIEEKMAAVTTTAGNPRLYTPRLKKAGIKVIHVVGTVEHAVKAAEAGVDAVVCAGTEAGGWQSHEEVTTLCLVPEAVDALEGRIPVIAAGGICDARGVAAAFCLGAEGVQLGTWLVASNEGLPSEEVKELILKATGVSTEIVGRGEGRGRVGPARNWTEHFLQEVSPEHKRRRFGPEAGASGGVGLIREILSVKEIMECIVEGIGEAQSMLNQGVKHFKG